MSEERTPTPPHEDPPEGATIGALTRVNPHSDARQRIERRIEASALATNRRTRSDRLTFTVIVLAAFGLLTWVFQAFADAGPGPLSPLLIAIGLATWYGGPWQGLIATAGALTIGYFLMDPAESFERPDTGEAVHIGSLLFVAPAVALVSDGLRSSVVHSNDLAETRRRLLMAVVASEERWRTFNESVPALMSESTNDGDLTYCNAQWMRYTGLPFESIRDDPLVVAHPDDRAQIESACQKAISNAAPMEVEWRMRRHDGAYRWHYGIAIPTYNGETRFPMWVGVNVDIDARKRAEAELTFQRDMRDQSEARARLAMLAAHLESWICEIEDGTVTIMRREVSPGRHEKPQERWQQWLARVHPQDRDVVAAAVQDSIAMRRELDLDFRIIERNRSVRWMHVWGRVLYGEDRRPRNLIAVQQDVTEHKRAEESAREGEEHLRRLAEANIIGVASGVGDVITEANDNFLDMLQYTRHDLAEHRLRWEALSPPGEERIDGDTFRELLQRGAAQPRRRDYVCRSGARRHVLVGMLLLERRPFRWVTFNIDLTDQVNGEELLHQALLAAEDANASKDEFVALVAHELRAPITTIAGNAEILENRAALIDAESRDAALADIRSEADRLRRMIQDLLVLARLERHVEIEPEPVRIERVIRDVTTRHQRSFPQRVVDTHLPAQPPLVLASAAYTDQVISNLLVNAEKYSPKDRPIELAVDTQDGHMRVRVLDHGSGIAPEEIDEIFRPFYRSRITATRAEGFGIGLTVCRRLVEAQGGKIWAKARPEGGTEFGFTLPVALEDNER